MAWGPVRGGRWARLRRSRLAPVLSAVLLGLSFPPLHIPLLPFVGLVPLVLWVAALPADDRGRREALSGGFLFGAVHFALLFHWVPVALLRSGGALRSALFAVPAFLVIVTGLAALAAVAVWLLHRGVRVHHAPLGLVVPVVWTALEWSRAHLPGTLALPWLGLGTSLTGFPELLGIAELVGGRGVTFWIACVNGLLAGLVLRVRGQRPRRAAAVGTALVVAVPAAWGVWRAGTLEVRPAATVAVVQPDAAGRVKVGEDGEGNGREAAAAAGQADAGARAAMAPPSGAPDIAHLLARLQPGEVDVVVLPELFLRRDPRSPEGVRAAEALQEHVRDLDAPILFGGLAVDDGASAQPGQGGGDARAGDDAASEPAVPYNSVFLMRRDGLAGFRYDKRRLVPVVERIPFLPSRAAGTLQAAGAYGVGEGWPLAEVAGARFGALVCYESSYPEAARALRLEGADVLVNVTNDAWLGGGPFLSRTVALWQHPAHLVVRAVENRMGVVRAANTGISLFVDPTGEVHERTDLFVEDLRTHPVVTTDVETVFTRYGDVVGNVSALVAAGLLFLAVAGVGPRRATRRKTAPSLDPSRRDV